MIPAKVLLFGEYTVLLGSHALALPNFNYGGTLRLNATTNKDIASHKAIETYTHWLLKTTNLHFPLFKDQLFKDVSEGLYFDSSIPLGSGLGSSGALVAALAKKYAQLSSSTQLIKLKNELSAMESFFHGQSSGIDPLVAYLGKPIVFWKGGSKIDILDKSHFSHINYKLVNLNRISKTDGLIDVFNAKLQEPKSESLIKQDLVNLTNEIIENLVYHRQIPFEKISTFCKIQQSVFPEMYSQEGLHFIQYSEPQPICKICGSGGAFLIQF